MRWNENKNLLAWIIIIIAIIPASDDWYLAKIFVLLWILTGLFQMFRPRLQSAETDAILHYLLLSYSLWAILDYLFPVLHPILMILIWLLLFIYILFHWIGSPRKSVLVPHSCWITKPYVIVFFHTLALFWLLLHYGLTRYIGYPFALSWWSSLTWSLMVVILLYPAEIKKQSEIFQIPLWFLVLLILITSGTHFMRYRSLSGDLYTSPRIQQVVQKAFTHGYDLLGVQAVGYQTRSLLHTKGWVPAVKQMRSNWKFQHRKYFSRQWRKDPVTRDNIFFMAVCFGIQLQLMDNESIVDWDPIPSQEEIWFCTSSGRVMVLDKSGITCRKQMNVVPVAMDVFPPTNSWVLLASDQFIIMPSWNEQPITHSLPKPDWKDIQFSASGDSLYLLHGTGEVVEYIWNATETEQIETRPIAPALWEESTHAQALISVQDHLLLADIHGGVFPAIPSSTLHWSAEELSKYYIPQRNTIRSIVPGRTEDELLMLDSSGWVFFIGTDTPIMRILFPVDEVVGLTTLPEDLGLLEITQFGRIIPYVLPQGTAITPGDRSTRIPTDVTSE